MKPYTDTGEVDCDVDLNTGNVRGKTAVVTGGASGIGEATVRALSRAGAFVLMADRDEKSGETLSWELGSSVKFVKCDVSVWAEQLTVFKEAIALSPDGRVDIVIVNAGITGPDPIFGNDAEEPQEPNLKIIDVNIVGALYTVKLALHYLRRNSALSKGIPLDQVLVLVGSMAAYHGVPGSLQYTFSKHGLRGLFKSLRLTEPQNSIRLGFIAPWAIRTKILSEAVVQRMNQQGIDWAHVEDAAEAIMRIVSDTTIQGRSFGIVPRSLAPRGYADLCDDTEEGTIIHKLAMMAIQTNHRGAIDPKTGRPYQ